MLDSRCHGSSPGQSLGGHTRNVRVGEAWASSLFLIAAGTLTLLALTALFCPAAGLPIPDNLSEYIPAHPFPSPGGNPLPPAHGGSPQSHPHPPPPPPPDSNSHTPLDTDASSPELGLGNIDAAINALYAAQPHSRTRPPPHARYTLKTGRAPLHGFDAFIDYAGRVRRGACGLFAVWQAERRAPQRGWFRQRVKVVEERARGLGPGDDHTVIALNPAGGGDNARRHVSYAG
ncbi:hypothetical protein C8R44DRAFT_751932 [Mycena epipterygia]|nr:hypothetical protein C8R44DRAFT_751932 [Mycena epipterygia]